MALFGGKIPIRILIQIPIHAPSGLAI